MTSQLVPIGQKPRMLKDFLADNSHSKRVSFFQDNLNMTFSNNGFSKFLVKYLPFTTNIKPPSILPKNIRKRLSKSRRVHRNVNMKELTVKVKVKDILRWRSFRDLAEVESPPLNFSSSPHHCTTVTTTTVSSSITSSSGRSSWCDSDFTAEDLPSWCSNSNQLVGVNGDVEKYSVTPKVHWLCDEEKEQNSPLSVLDFCSQEDQESLSYFRQTPRRKQARIELFANKNIIHEQTTNGVEEKAMQVLNQVKTNTFSSIGCLEIDEEFLLLDFFMEQLSDNRKGDNELLKVASEWIRGEDDGCLEWKLVGKKEFSIRDMERGVKWNEFDEDEQQVGSEIENHLLNRLVDEVLSDFLNL
ncbi:Ankyrin repeat domain-containing protein [Heracleum sosnowskyi]|uniref:Ankyrin repeat domain-containing protein n=1 Tax=Heracleum sosnowskyi TaxID=360622 RepID=A0AAD8MLY2_9APIA|nr:Ankyrin repeat domain-containing protein [Heracleum sosnowskyi]